MEVVMLGADWEELTGVLRGDQIQIPNLVG